MKIGQFAERARELLARINTHQCNIQPRDKNSLATSLEKLVLQRHIRLRLEAHARAEDVGQRCALLRKRVYDRRSGRRQRRLEHVAEDGQHAVKLLVLAVAAAVGALPLDARHHLRYEHEVDDQWRGEEGVLADVEDAVGRRLILVQYVS